MIKKAFFTFSMLIAAGMSSAQTIADGYYRFQNQATERYIVVVDNTGSVDIFSTSADLGAIHTFSDFEGNVISNPGSIIYAKYVSDGYDLQSQGVSTYKMVSYYLRIRNSGAIMAIDINSLYYHPTNVEKVVMVFGKKIYYVKMPRWKTYCAARNKTYIAKKYFGMSGVLKLTLRDLLYIIVVPGDRVGRLIETVKGRKDGLQNKFDRKLDFSK